MGKSFVIADMEGQFRADTIYYKDYLEAESLETLIDLMDGDDEILLDLVETSLDSNSELLQDLISSVETQNADGVREAAHSLKSSNGQLGATAFSNLCLDMEMMGKNGDLSSAPETLLKLKEEADRLEKALTSWKKDLS
ncbi:MAG: Hpt domain-containing protein [Bacteroidota bacterium]